MLRSIFVVCLLVVGLRYALKGSFYLLLCYLCLAYFRPEQWLWIDFVTPLKLSLILGSLVVLTALFSHEHFKFGWGPLLFVLFLGQSLVSVIDSANSIAVWPLWIEFSKTVVVSFMIVTLISNEERLRLALTVVTFSVAFDGAKQGFAQFVLNPGQPNINGSPVFGDNNGVAVGMLMLTPILVALARAATKRWERYLERFLAVGLLLRALGTYSRGGFLAAGALAAHYLLRSRRRLIALVAVGLLGTAVLTLLPRGFWNRMQTIQTDAEDPDAADASAAGRIYFWQVAYAMANDRPLMGVGFDAYQSNYDKYDTTHGLYGPARAVHSAWFGVLAELGYTGLLLFVLLFGYAFLVCARARRLSQRHPEMANLGGYATAIEASFVAFAVGGAFVAFQYEELFWHLLAFAMALDHIAVTRARALDARRTPVVRSTIALPALAGAALTRPARPVGA
jgi:probable O-glycosylation ligase (exosortase A-associated)